jgi:bifunctional UDP-N-acetylglucosamine pyrophosphorylase/glucosamine-1-phosphate N-acetyltransferase
MTNRKTAAIVLAAGRGTRMKSDVPKVLHPLAGLPMVRHVLAALARIEPEVTLVVVAPGMEAVAAAIAPARAVVQEQPLGTADAVRSGFKALGAFDGDILVLCGDAPLIMPETLARLLAARRGAGDPAAVVLGMVAKDPGEYGRLVLDESGGLARIVEHREASAAECAIRLCNAGAYAFDGKRLSGYLGRVGNDNAKGEFYLTDVIALARASGARVAVVEAEERETMGVNSRIDLARAERVMQERLRAQAMAEGATLIDPDSVHFSFDTKLGRDVTVEPNVFFGPGVVVGNGVEIRANCHIEGARVAEGATVGPFARLRPGARIGRGARIGNFVEVKQATVGDGAKINHLAYVGDAAVGAAVNIGAGVITCNYDGFEKARTEIGKGVFIGSNSSLVAPVAIGDGAIVGAGSVISGDVAPGSLALSRAAQEERPGWAEAFRARKRKGKGRHDPAGLGKPGKRKPRKRTGG